jgi:hypothetical protein
MAGADPAWPAPHEPGPSTQPQGHQLGSMAHQLPQLPLTPAGDIRIGQPVHPQQTTQICGIVHIVLTADRKSLSPPRDAPHAPEHPRPATHPPPNTSHTSPPAPLADPGPPWPAPTQRNRVVINAYPVQLLAFPGHPHAHTAPAMHINPHVLPTVVVCARGGLLRRRSEHPEISSGHRGEWRPHPAASSHQAVYSRSARPLRRRPDVPRRR